MSRVIDPHAQHARRLGRPVPETPAELPPLSAAAVMVGWEEEPVVRRTARLVRALAMPPGAEPLVIRTGRGVLHRGYRTDDGRVHAHARCHAVPAVECLPKGAEYWFDNLSRPDLMCRYSWCFRELLEEMGVDTFVGHRVRRLRKRAAA